VREEIALAVVLFVVAFVIICFIEGADDE
jgi:hypothetical protein